MARFKSEYSSILKKLGFNKSNSDATEWDYYTYIYQYVIFIDNDCKIKLLGQFINGETFIRTDYLDIEPEQLETLIKIFLQNYSLEARGKLWKK